MAYSPKYVAAFLLTAFILLVVVKMYVDSETAKAFMHVMDFRGNDNVEAFSLEMLSESVLGNTKHFIDQRNDLSRMLNMKQQKIGQMHCEVCLYLNSQNITHY